ncbi:MAG: DUF177 domain-containing protein [Desulfobacterota bacterium]|nr:DUF177 domain-containing protein [Thermodesulfobacteriota bacterium]
MTSLKLGCVFSIAVEDIPDAGLHLTTSWDSAALVDILEAQNESFTVMSPVELDFRFSRSADTIIAEGSLQLVVQLQCVRCLSVFMHRLDETYRYVLVSQTGTPQRHTQPDEEDTDIAYYTGESIDLRPLVREQIYLAMPDYPHCSEACKGLCPQCGTNLNETICDCSRSAEAIKTLPFRIRRHKK